MTKECYVPQTLGEETGRRDKRDERKSTVLDNPDGEKGDWVTMMTKGALFDRNVGFTVFVLLSVAPFLFFRFLED